MAQLLKRLMLFLVTLSLLGACQRQPQPAWLTPVRTAAPKIAASATPAHSPTTTGSPKGAASPAASLPTPPPLPFSPLKDGTYMYIPMKNVNLWGKWVGYYRLPQAPNVLIFVEAYNEYRDSPHEHNLRLSFAFQVYGIAPDRIATPFPPHRTPGGMTATTYRFVLGLRQIYLPNKTPLIAPQDRDGIYFVGATRESPSLYRTPIPGVFIAGESIGINLPAENPLRGGALWHGKETIDCIVELDVAPGFHLQGPLRLWVPISYYNGPPP